MVIPALHPVWSQFRMMPWVSCASAIGIASDRLNDGFDAPWRSCSWPRSHLLMISRLPEVRVRLGSEFRRVGFGLSSLRSGCFSGLVQHIQRDIFEAWQLKVGTHLVYT